MRCRKVRSLLSIYSHDELIGRQQAEVREHLASCADCRREAAVHVSLLQAKQEVPGMKVAEDFNTRLLNRIAQERFAETRTKAYMPKRVPVFNWRTAVPALAMTAVAVLVAVGLFVPGTGDNSANFASLDQTNGDLYRTVQPSDNPNMAAMNKNWSLDKVLARLDRVDEYARGPQTNMGFTQAQLASSTSRPMFRSVQPYGGSYHKVQPVIRMYETKGMVRPEEGKKVY